MFIETNPIPVKTAMNLLGMNAGSFRLPLVPMGERNKAELVAVLKRYGFSIPPEEGKSGAAPGSH
jgi:4-hydroxy-tetrahydrodipicolinate synthase